MAVSYASYTIEENMVKKDEPSYCQQDSLIAKIMQLPPLYHQHIRSQVTQQISP